MYSSRACITGATARTNPADFAAALPELLPMAKVSGALGLKNGGFEVS